MKRLLVFLMFLLAAGFVFAQSSQTEQPQTPQEPSATSSTPTTPTETSSLHGTVESIDMNAKTITVRDESGKTMKYTYNTATTFSRQDQPFTITELKTGDKVTYIINDGDVLTTLTIDEDETNPPQK